MIRAIVVMGVSGSGKSTLGKALAPALGWRFVEGDTLHPVANIAKMAADIPLDDEDRRPFLDAVARVIADSAPDGIIVSCSALKRSYRDRIRIGDRNVVFIVPVLSRQQLQARLNNRPGHFMPPALLDSQLAALEPLQSDETSIKIPGNSPLERQVQDALQALQALGVGPP